jgi:hypothetical protein
VFSSPLLDPIVLKNASEQYFFEQKVRIKEVLVLRDKLEFCRMRESVNGIEKCRYLREQYTNALKGYRDGWKKPMVLPNGRILADPVNLVGKSYWSKDTYDQLLSKAKELLFGSSTEEKSHH